MKFLKKQKELVSYLFFGILTTLVNYIVYFFCTKILHTNYMIAQVSSWICAVMFAYVTNRSFVFESKNNNLLNEMGGFFAGRLFSGMVEAGLLFFTVSILRYNADISKIVVSMISVILNYFISKLFVFKPTATEKGD